jgi:hypothetical protein
MSAANPSSDYGMNREAVHMVKAGAARLSSRKAWKIYLKTTRHHSTKPKAMY